MKKNMSYVLLSVLALFTVGVNSMTVLPKCSLAAEEYVYRCNGDALLGWISDTFKLNSIMASINTRAPRQGEGGEYSEIHGSGSASLVCSLYTKYEGCITNFGMRLKCSSRMDMMIGWMYSYICNEGFEDFRGSLECLIHSELDVSLNKQYSMGTCREAVFGELQALGTYMKSLNVAVDDVEELETHFFPVWCKIRIMSVECYEPAYMRVCGLAAKRFIHGIIGSFDKVIAKAFGHAINCTKPAAALGRESGPESNFSTPEDPTNKITKTGPGLKPPLQTFISTLKKSEQEIRQMFGPCNVLDVLLSGLVCFYETIAEDGKGIPSMHITNTMQYLEVLCESSMQFEKCELPKMCGQNFMTDVMDLLDSSCGMFAAVKKEKQRGCYLPSSVTLDLKKLCGYSWYDFQYQLTSLNQPADVRRTLDQCDLLIKPFQCMVDHEVSFLMSHLPAGCSDDVRDKVKDTAAKIKTGPHIVSEMIQSIRKFMSQIPMLSRGRNNF